MLVLALAALTRRQRLESWGARRLLRLPPGLLRRLGGPPIQRGSYTLDPQVQLALRLHRLLGKPASHELEVAAARRALRADAALLAAPPRPGLTITEDTLDGPGGTLAIRVYRPDGLPSSAAPALVFFHGGGFVLGDLDSHDDLCQAIATEGRCHVLSVAYRLAPEHPFPAAARDAVAGFREVHRRAEALGIDPTRIGVAGDSAGGNLAAHVALKTRGEAAHPRLQLLLYPCVDLTSSFPSIHALGRGFFLDKATIDWFLRHYLAGADPRHPMASPYFIDDLSDAPPALVLTAGFDPLRDEGDAYAARLAAAGVPVDHRRYGGMFHGFLNCGGAIDVAAQAHRDLGAWLSEKL